MSSKGAWRYLFGAQDSRLKEKQNFGEDVDTKKGTKNTKQNNGEKKENSA